MTPPVPKQRWLLSIYTIVKTSMKPNITILNIRWRNLNRDATLQERGESMRKQIGKEKVTGYDKPLLSSIKSLAEHLGLTGPGKFHQLPQGPNAVWQRIPSDCDQD